MVTVPESTEGLVYFSNRTIGEGKAMAWVYQQKCPKCGKATMGKPKDEKTGKVKIRSKEYVCPECNNTTEKKEYEEGLTMEIQYTCPECKHKGEAEVPYKRKKVKIMVDGEEKKADAVVFNCGKCDAKIPITKKMK